MTRRARRHRRLATAVMALGVIFGGGTPAATAAPEPVAPRGEHRVGPAFALHRSVSIETWFRWNDDISTWDDYMSDVEIAQLVDVGFGTARLSLFPQYFMGGSGDLRDRRWAYVDAAVDRLTAAGLTVVVDLHSEHQVMTPFTTSGRFRDRYVRFVERVATRLASRDPALVALSLMNEPHDTGGRWDAWQRRLHRVARDAAPALTLVLTTDDWGSARSLPDTAYIEDPNLIWDVHIYEPFPFTHQGATWVGYPVQAFRRVPYPSSPRKVRPAIRASQRAAPAAWDQVVRADLLHYGRQHWRRAKLEQLLQQLAAWSREHDATVWVGELGVATTAPRAPAYRWWRHLRTEAEQAGVAWSTWFWWDYAHKHGDDGYDARLARALGLDVPAA